MCNSQVVLSVIMPVYNGEKYIEEAILSVLKQPEKDLVLIVINDGSKDNTQELIERIAENDDRLIIIQQENSGVSIARNRGIVKSLEIGARYIAFLDSDDVWVKNFFKKLTVELLESGMYDLIGFDYFVGSEDLSKGSRKIALDNKPEGIYPFVNHFSSFLYSTEVLRNHKVIVFPEGIKIYEDVAFLMLFNYFCQSYNSFHEPSFIYRSNHDSVTKKSNDSIKVIFDSYIPVWDWIASILSKDYKAIEVCKSMKRACLIEYIQQACRMGKNPTWINSIIELNEGKSILYDNRIYINNEYQDLLQNYMRNQNAFWVKNRLYGLFISLRQVLKRIRIINRFYNNKVYYKDNIKEFHCF